MTQTDRVERNGQFFLCGNKEKVPRLLAYITQTESFLNNTAEEY